VVSVINFLKVPGGIQSLLDRMTDWVLTHVGFAGAKDPSPSPSKNSVEEKARRHRDRERLGEDGPI